MAESRSGNPVSSLKEGLTSSPAAERLKQEATAFAAAQAQRLLVSAGRKLGGATARLNDVAEGNSPGLVKLATESGKKFAEGKGPLRSAVEIGASGLKDKAKEAFQGLAGGGRRKGGGGQGKFVTIVEDIDVGVPLREAYDQWTQYQEFSTFTKGVQGVESSGDTSSNWRAKILWSNRSWKADTTEQIPDERIAWTSEGAKGTTKGVVTFHALGDSLTRVLLVIEYHPKGLFEKTGNIWRAQGRRARLDLKHFRRFVTMRGEATGSWRGEIRDGEVVLSHEDAVENEENEENEEDEAQERSAATGASTEEDAPPGESAEDGGEDGELRDEDWEEEPAEDTAAGHEPVEEEAPQDGTDGTDAYEDEEAEEAPSEAADAEAPYDEEEEPAQEPEEEEGYEYEDEAPDEAEEAGDDPGEEYAEEYAEEEPASARVASR